MTTESIWKKTSFSKSAYAPLTDDTHVDVLVVGAGITGLTTAEALKRAGRTVAVVERDCIGSGTSGSTSAHLTSLIDFKYHSLIKSFGQASAERVARSLTQAIDHIESLCSEHGIDCQFKRIPGYLYAEDDAQLEKVRSEFAAARQVQLPVRLLKAAPLPFPNLLALEIDQQAQFQPMDYLHGLARAIHGQGSIIYEGTTVTEIHDGSPCVVETEYGRITAQAVVLATHTPLGVNLVQTELRNNFSFVLAAQIAEELPQALFWDNADPYHYIRNFQQGDRRFVIIGGKDHPVGHGSSQLSMQQLEEYARHRFDVLQVEDSWSAQYFDPTDGLPFIGKSPFHQHIYLATGYGGDGLTLGTVAGFLLPELILKGEAPYAELYQPGRLHFTGMQNLLKKNYEVAKHFVSDRILATPPRQLDELRAGEGCVIRNGREYIAASRDADGHIVTLSAVCPHMKCIVHWNDAEKTWDCPCHGSRFDTLGHKLEGPALSGLAEFGWPGAAEEPGVDKETARQPNPKL